MKARGNQRDLFSRMRAGCRRALFLVALFTCACAAAFDALDSLAAPDDAVKSLLDDLGEPSIISYLPMDGHADALAHQYRLSNMGSKSIEFERGLVGEAARCDKVEFKYSALEILDESSGALAFWFKRGEGTPPAPKAFIANKWIVEKSDVFARAPEGWHFWVVNWSEEGRSFDLYLDAELVKRGALPLNGFGKFFSPIGECSGLLDETYVLDMPLSPADMRKAIERGLSGKPTFAEASEIRPAEYRYEPDISDSLGARPALPESFDWREKPDMTRKTRAIYSLDGFWRLQPFGAPEPISVGEAQQRKKQFNRLEPKLEPWAFVKVPGSWKPFGDDVFSNGNAFSDPKSARPLTSWQGKNLSLFHSAWLERDFYLQVFEPENGAYLRLERCRPTCSIFVNGKFLLHHASSSPRVYEITDKVVPGKNRITILCGRPYEALTTITEDGKMWLPAGLLGSASIEIKACRTLVANPPIPMPSVREQKLGLEISIGNTSENKMSLTLKSRVRDLANGAVRELKDLDLSLAPGEHRIVREFFPFKSAPLWTPDDPRLLSLETELLRDGKLLDEPDPVRFGFREVWVEGSDLMMNGYPFRLRGQCHSFGAESPDAVEWQIKSLRRLGFNSSIGLFLGPYAPRNTKLAERTTLDVSDEQGFMLNYKVYVYGNTAEERLASARKQIAIYRQHPSVALITRAVYGYLPQAHGSPISLGMELTDEIRGASGYIKDQRLVDIIHEAAPGLPFGYYQQGLAGDYRSVMQYLGPGTPLQTMEEWPRYWAEQRPAPFVGNEVGVLLDAYLWNWQGGAGHSSKRPELLVTEHAARYFGEAAYRRQVHAEAAGSADGSAEKEVPNLTLLRAEFAKRVIRSWRSYGISYFLLGMTQHLLDADESNPEKLVFVSNNSPFLAYIGGGEGDFSRKDHAFFSGEKIEKQAVLINDYFHEVDANAEWRLVNEGSTEIIGSGSKRFVLKPGDIIEHAFSFSAPPVARKSKFKIELSVAAGEELASDSFELEVFPHGPKPESGRDAVLLADNEGSAASILKQAGVNFKGVILSAGKPLPRELDSAGLLVIGRRSLPADEAIQAALFKAAENGLKILCFEQSERSVFGLLNDDPNTRHAFITARAQPLFEGLDDEDFRNWRGSSDILEPYPDYRKGVKYGLLENKRAKGYFGESEFAQWSANGTVATFHFEKPQKGRFRILLSSGFDLLYSPLLELLPGSGRVILCQLDVSNRYGRDPVATLIVNRLLSRAIATEPEPASQLVFAGARDWKAILDEIKADSIDIETVGRLDANTVLFAGLDSEQVDKDKAGRALPAPDLELKDASELGSAVSEFFDELEGESVAELTKPLPENLMKSVAALEKRKADILSFVQAGGTLVVAGLSKQSVSDWIPVSVKVRERDASHAAPSGSPILEGLTLADFFFRNKVALSSVSGLPDGSELEPNGLFAIAPCGKGRVIFCQLTPFSFQKAWQRSKVLRFYATLLTNLSIPARTLQAEELSSCFYSSKALSFNPDQHTSW